jgi:hypothetical protein
MQFGIMMRGQFPPEDNARERFGDLMEQARVAQELGFASLTKGSHYSTTPFLQFQQLPFLARLAADPAASWYSAPASATARSSSRPSA